MSSALIPFSCVPLPRILCSRAPLTITEIESRQFGLVWKVFDRLLTRRCLRFPAGMGRGAVEGVDSSLSSPSLSYACMSKAGVGQERGGVQQEYASDGTLLVLVLGRGRGRRWEGLFGGGHTRGVVMRRGWGGIGHAYERLSVTRRSRVGGTRQAVMSERVRWTADRSVSRRRSSCRQQRVDTAWPLWLSKAGSEVVGAGKARRG